MTLVIGNGSKLSKPDDRILAMVDHKDEREPEYPQWLVACPIFGPQPRSTTARRLQRGDSICLMINNKAKNQRALRIAMMPLSTTLGLFGSGASLPAQAPCLPRDRLGKASGARVAHGTRPADSSTGLD
jgi:hypothetical protein